MQESAEIYEELIRLVETRAAPLASQIREEVARGRLVQGAKLPQGEREERQSRLTEAKLGRIGKTEMAVLPYTGDERLALLCQSLLTLTQTMTESRRVVHELAVEHEIEHTRVSFAEAGETDIVDLDLAVELTQAELVLREVTDLLEPLQGEVGVWH